jgi:hypothetical protein
MRSSWGRPSSDDDWCRLLLPSMLFISGREWWRWGVGSCCFSRVDEGVGDLNYFGRRRYRRFVSKHGLSMQWRRRFANPRIIWFSIADDVWLIRVVSFNSPFHLILHWNHYLCSQPLPGNSFAIDRILGTFPFPILLILSLPFFFYNRCYPFLVFAIKRHQLLSVLLTSSCFLLLLI